jgi:hypothetical protein
MVLEDSREGDPRLKFREQAREEVREEVREKDPRLESGKNEPNYESDQESQVEARVKSLGARVAQCLLASDTASLEALLGDGFVLRMPDGERIFKEELLHLVANRQMRYESLMLELSGVHVYDGQVAFLSGHCNSDKFFRGRRLTGRFPFTALSVRRHGNWQIVAIHHLEPDERARGVTP